MLRIYELDILCPICHKPDYCLVAEDGTACICTRISEGSVKKCGRAGWLHVLKPGQFTPKQLKPTRKPPINWDALHKLYRDKLSAANSKLNLGLKKTTLLQFGMGFDGQGFTFPMVSPSQDIIGMQIRYPDGKKRVVKGSSCGLFIPRPLNINDRILLISEGMSDAAVLTEMGYGAIGRYNCCSGQEEVKNFVQLYDDLIDKVIIVSDRNPAEQAGAKEVAKCVQQVKPTLVIIPEKAKDIREAYLNGITKQIFDKIVGSKNGY